MKALTLWQPWASFMLCSPERPKRNETRPRRTNHRGPLAIHSAKREPRWVREAFCEPGPLRELLLRHLWDRDRRFDFDVFDALPRGRVLGTVELIDCIKTEDMGSMPLSQDEYDLGDYSDGRFVLPTRNARRLAYPIEWRGAQGFWTLPDRKAYTGFLHSWAQLASGPT